MTFRIWVWGYYIEVGRRGFDGWGHTLMADKIIVGLEVRYA